MNPRPNVRKVLAQIEAVLMSNQENKEACRDAKQLWDILTALRGPDNDVADRVKFATTVYIRQAAFPTYAEAVTHGTATELAYMSPRVRLFDEPTQIVVADARKCGGHFHYHINAAARALGLIE